MEFRTTVLAARQDATGLPVPDDVVAALGAGHRAAAGGLDTAPRTVEPPAVARPAATPERRVQAVLAALPG
ncbi:MAG: hypothetical protein JWQ53_2410 [Klenkia sp.]|nr:hypothetical protein [Klenkia sp.]